MPSKKERKEVIFNAGMTALVIGLLGIGAYYFPYAIAEDEAFKESLPKVTTNFDTTISCEIGGRNTFFTNEPLDCSLDGLIIQCSVPEGHITMGWPSEFSDSARVITGKCTVDQSQQQREWILYPDKDVVEIAQ